VSTAAARADHPTVHVNLARRTRRGWAPPARELTRWVAAALGPRGAECEISVLVVGAKRSRSLNARYRRQDHATNVLSFPAAPDTGAPGGIRRLGDLVICPEVLEREARTQRKARGAHWAHLVVHGVLHLIGYDHGRDQDARRMERREVRALRTLGLPNPYRVTATHG
jgi:probable rRNA maturation factor